MAVETKHRLYGNLYEEPKPRLKAWYLGLGGILMH